MPRTEWITPFKKQCFVTLGVSLNMSLHGLVMGFAAILLPQLKQSDSKIPIDDNSGSWIASVVGFALVIGNFIVPSVMGKYGRKVANLVSIVPMLIGWLCIVVATNVTMLMVARILQGIAMGMTASLGPVLIGEYTSPNNRGAFLTTVSVAMASGVLIAHTMGLFMTWKITAMVCAALVVVDLLIILYSPESPSWLADQGRYDDCKRIFRWLRGNVEEVELRRIIENSIIVRESKQEANVTETFSKSVKMKMVYFNSTIRKKEFFKPIFIMIHFYVLSQWAGANILATYTVNIFHGVIGDGANISLLILTMDVQRIISNIGAVYVIRKIKRRTILFITVGINIFALLAIAGYTYTKANNLLPFDNQAIGIILIHIHMFSIATGTIPLPFIIAGELFPLEYKSLAGGISILFLSSNLFINIKITPLLFNSIGLYGAYLLYAAVVIYCLIIIGLFLPETKDRTLQDIEDEFRGRPLTLEELKSTQSLTSVKLQNRDRRCSSPMV